MESDILTIKELAKYLRINEKTAYRLAFEQKLPGFRVGGSWRFRRAAVDAWIAEEECKGKGDQESQ